MPTKQQHFFFPYTVYFQHFKLVYYNVFKPDFLFFSDDI